MKSLPALTAILTAATALAQPALAQSAPNQPGPGKFFAATDTNKDGAISKAEWTASGRNPQGFAMMDTNRDGKVTRAEADAAMARMMGGGAPASAKAPAAN